MNATKIIFKLFFSFILIFLTVSFLTSLFRKNHNMIEPFYVCLNNKYRCYQPLTKKPGEKMYYILQWTPKYCSGFPHYFKAGQCAFKENNCEYTNCYFTSNKQLLKDITKYQVIVFSGHERELPQRRSPHQKYAFSIKESPERNPVCSVMYNDFFNWTWTYRLDSDSYWGYIEIRDSNNTVIGPKQEMHWMKLEDMKPVPKQLREKLSKKTLLAAWFVSKCTSKSEREKFVQSLNEELKPSGHEVHIYGECGKFKCERTEGEEGCDRIVEQHYFFYLALENCFDTDYVTEKLLRPLNFNAIPIVYGGANYTRFMPNGTYLNARELGVKKLAAKMLKLSKNFDQYVEYFRWKSHYSYRDSEPSDYCRICALLNNETKIKETTVHKNFLEWWNIPYRCLNSMSVILDQSESIYDKYKGALSLLVQY